MVKKAVAYLFTKCNFIIKYASTLRYIVQNLKYFVDLINSLTLKYLCRYTSKVFLKSFNIVVIIHIR